MIIFCVRTDIWYINNKGRQYYVRFVVLLLFKKVFSVKITHHRQINTSSALLKI